jgi:hypothetical protein
MGEGKKRANTRFAPTEYRARERREERRSLGNSGLTGH